MAITIYHNPACSKSRQTLDLIRRAGIEPEIIHYLENPPDAARIQQLATQIGVPVHELIREGGSDDAPRGSDAAAAWLAMHPKHLQRPIVADEQRRIAVIGRPPENALTLLPGHTS